MARTEDYEKYFMAAYGLAVAIIALNLYCFSGGVFRALGLTWAPLDHAVLRLRQLPVLDFPLRTKLWAYLIAVISCVPRTGRGTKADYPAIISILSAGTAVYLLPVPGDLLYLAATVVGMASVTLGAELLGRRLRGTEFNEASNDKSETFEQCRDLVESDYSVNIPTRFKYHGRMHDGWINIVAPFRASMVLGIPGSGKSFSVYGPYIEQMTAKGYAMFIYDYKYPDLSRQVYNEMLWHYGEGHAETPEFCVINFNDPRRSLRCNPIHARYLSDPADATEIAEIIMNNLTPGQKETKDFFDRSAEVYSDSLIWFLRIYEDGRYCTLPHFIELMSQNYEDVFEILKSYPEVETKIRPFANALAGGAQEQLQGQIASAQIPLSKFSSPVLYWVMSGDDFDLDMNDAEHPKVICVGNDPDRQNIYSTALALYTSRMFKLINHKGKRHSAVLLDELPTIYVKGLDQLVNTARSNRVAVVLGLQDKTQLERDYGEKYASVIFNTVGNVLFGAVKGKTAQEFSKSFGREFRRQESQTQSIDSESVNVSFHQQDLLPVDVIEGLSVGWFGGVVADDFDHPIERKFFLSQIQRDAGTLREKAARSVDIPEMTDFGRDGLYSAIDADPRSAMLEWYMARPETAEALVAQGLTVSSRSLLREAEQWYGALSAEERDRKLSEVKEAMYDSLVENTIRANYLRIKEEAASIIANEFARLGKTPKGNGSAGGAARRPVDMAEWSRLRAEALGA